jgi:NADH-quinone oxidoreductase subunit L
MISEFWVWLIFLFPFGSFVVSAVVIRPFFDRYSKLSGYLTILAIGAALVLAVWALGSVVDNEGPLDFPTHRWLEVGSLEITLGVLLDPLTAIMLVIVTGVSLLIQIYSVGYMRGDPGFTRFYAYMSLFTASMIGLVMAANIVQLYFFWELVGLCSYLLIGFWYHRPAAAAAAKKAFIVTRLGDFGFLMAILYLAFNADVFTGNGLEISVINTELPKAVAAGLIGTSVITWIAVGIFAGAVGKSGQFPLHTWLPDAMEGPTPVSALIHAATMVTAGVFLVARFFPLFEVSQVAMNLVAIIGGVTAIFAATMGLVMYDIKRVLAYSTISQLGYMMLALGVGAYGAAIFHLFTHAFFKALLFLGSGSVNHATGTFDMRYMGGLRNKMRWTYATFMIGGLSLAGVFPLAGFWSKDEILARAWGQGGNVSQIVFWLALIAVFMTAFYMFRALFMTFHGEFRGGAEEDPAAEPHGGVHLGESPAVMVAPLLVLGVASVMAGFFANPTTDLGIVPAHWFSEFLGQGLVHVEAEGVNLTIAGVSTVVALAGIALAYLMYSARRISPELKGGALRFAHDLLSRKYYFDELYEGYFVIRFLYGWISGFLDWADRSVVDGAVRGVDYAGRNVGRAMAQVQTGQLQGYGVVMSIGVLAILGVYLFLR